MQKSSTKSKRHTRAQRGMTFLLFVLIVTAGIVLHQRITPYIDATPNLNAHNLNSRNLTLKVNYTPSGPPAELVAGLPTQGKFTLAAVTRSGPTQFAPPPFSVSDETQTSATPDSTGIWIEVNGSIGLKALPLMPGKHSWRFGDFALKTYIGTMGSIQDGGEMIALGNPPTQGRIYSPALPPYPIQTIGFGQGNQTRVLLYQWMWMGRPNQASPDIPYRVNVPSPQDSSGTQASPSALLLTPRNLSRRFHLTVQPLSADQKPVGTSVTPRLVSIGEHLLFAEIPSGYSHQTQSFVLRLIDQQHPEQLSVWRIADLPQSVQKISERPSTVTKKTLGALTLTATATESPDYRQPDIEGYLNDSPPFVPPGQPLPQNIDSHVYTGLPSLRCRVQVQYAPSYYPGPDQTSALIIQSVTPQWTAPALMSSRPSVIVNRSVQQSPMQIASISSQQAFLERLLLTAFYISPSGAAKTIPEANTADMLYGIAYPGQQHFVQIQGEVVQYAYRTEKLTFHDADLVYDTTGQQGQITWKSPQTQTTPSGIAVEIMNSRSNMSVLPTGASVPNSVSLCLAWHLPEGTAWSGQASDHYYTDAVQLQPLTVQTMSSGISTSLDTQIQEVGWGKVWLPGAPLPTPEPPTSLDQRHTHSLMLAHSPLYLLIHNGYEAQILFILGNGLLPKAYSQHLRTITLVLRERILQKRSPFVLTVPVHKEQ